MSAANMDTKVHTLEINPAAVETITAMNDQAHAIHTAWQHHRPGWSNTPVLTLARCLAQMVGTGLGHHTKVYRDGDLSLFVTTESGLVYGVIFHALTHRLSLPLSTDPVHRSAPRMGRFCMAHLDGGKVCTEPLAELGRPTCTGHTPYVVAMPVPGEWSFHS